MGDVRYVDFKSNSKPTVWETEKCAGCFKDVEEVGDVEMLKLPSEREIRYIVLCKKCYRIAEDHGVL